MLVVPIRDAIQNRVAIVKPRHDLGLNQSLETHFIEAAFYLAYSAQMIETGFCDGRDVMSHR